MEIILHILVFKTHNVSEADLTSVIMYDNINKGVRDSHIKFGSLML